MAVVIRDGLVEQNRKIKEFNRNWFIFCATFFLLITLLAVFRTFFFVAFEVDGDSMNNTLNDGDILIINKVKKIERGDIVVFRVTEIDVNGNEVPSCDKDGNQIYYIKRVIGVGGDTVTWNYSDGVTISYKTSEGHYTVNLAEDYAVGSLHLPSSGKKTVPQDEYFVLGDNRNVTVGSHGSLGTIKRYNIVGVVTQNVVDNKDKFVSIFYRLF